MLLIATDLDGKSIEAKIYRQQLNELLRIDPGRILVYVSGKGLKTLTPILQKPDMPAANFIICDSGSTIVQGSTLEPVEPLQSNIEKQWPGTLKIQLFVNGIPGIIYRQVPQQRRCAFYSDDRKAIELVEREVQELGCEVIFSGDQLFDVVPKGVSKAATLRNLVRHLKIVESHVLIVGEASDDFPIFASDFHGVILNNAEARLIALTRNMNHIYHAKQAGVDGISEAIKYYGIG